MYLQNRSPHRALGHVTPEEAFSGKKPNVGHFCIFGCITYSYIPKEKRTKLEPTAEKGIFVGYSETFERLSDLYSCEEESCCQARCEIRGGQGFQEVTGVRVSGSARPTGAAESGTGIQWAGIMRIRRYIDYSVRSISEQWLTESEGWCIEQHAKQSTEQFTR